jgi:catechol-2,3-dioxygenase
VTVLGLRHAVLWVSDPKASARFYEAALGLEVKFENDQAVFMSSPKSATDHDLGLFRAKDSGASPQDIGLYHLAWEVATLGELAETKQRLADMGALVGENNHGVSRSLYCHDPDGIEFEIMWELPIELWDPSDPSNVPLDLEVDIARWGRDRAGRGLS